MVEVSEVGSAVATTALTGGNALTYLAGLRTVIAANEIIIKGLAAGAVLTILGYENTAEASEPTFGDSILWVIPTLVPYGPHLTPQVQVGKEFNDMVIIGDLRV